MKAIEEAAKRQESNAAKWRKRRAYREKRHGENAMAASAYRSVIEMAKMKLEMKMAAIMALESYQ
jgi:hypothetical protein